jgi:hypothetical protein
LWFDVTLSRNLKSQRTKKLKKKSVSNK